MSKKNNIKKLPEAELEIMLCLWDAGESVPRNYFNKQLSQKNWSDSTILTLLSRLKDKGFITINKEGNKNMYSPIIYKEEYTYFENSSFLNILHRGSIKHFIASLADTNSLTTNDINELENLLEELKK